MRSAVGRAAGGRLPATRHDGVPAAGKSQVHLLPGAGPGRAAQAGSRVLLRGHKAPRTGPRVYMCSAVSSSSRTCAALRCAAASLSKCHAGPGMAGHGRGLAGVWPYPVTSGSRIPNRIPTPSRVAAAEERNARLPVRSSVRSSARSPVRPSDKRAIQFSVALQCGEECASGIQITPLWA